MESNLERDIGNLVTNYQLSGKGITQFYVASTIEKFEEVMEEIRNRVGISSEKCLNHTWVETSDGNLDLLLDRQLTDKEQGGYLISAYGFVETVLDGHSLNQTIHKHHFDRGASILGIHIDPEHSNYRSALATAKDSHFKVRVIVLSE